MVLCGILSMLSTAAKMKKMIIFNKNFAQTFKKNFVFQKANF